jgi:hypothetical protein
MRLWSVQTGECLLVWEFPTAVKHVSFSDDDEQIVCITEQRMGRQRRHTHIGRPPRWRRHRAYVHALLPIHFLALTCVEQRTSSRRRCSPYWEQDYCLRVPVDAEVDPDGPREGKVAQFDAPSARRCSRTSAPMWTSSRTFSSPQIGPTSSRAARTRRRAYTTPRRSPCSEHSRPRCRSIAQH